MPDEYDNQKYCLNNFIRQMESDTLMNEKDARELKDLIFKDGVYPFPCYYYVEGERFSLCQAEGKDSEFRRLASEMKYEKKVVGGRSQTSLLNGNSLSALVGRFIYQFYIDRFQIYEAFFEKLLKKSGKTGSVGDTLKKLSKLYELKLDDGAGDVKKLVQCVIYSFRPVNLTYISDGKEKTSEIPSLRIRFEATADFFWQIAYTDPQSSCSRFSGEFGLKLYYPWLKKNWPNGDDVEKEKYLVKDKNGNFVSVTENPFNVPGWFDLKLLDEFIVRLAKLYVKSEGDRGNDPGTDDGPDDGSGDGPKKDPKGGPNSGPTESEKLFHEIFANDDVMAKILKKLAGIPDDERIRREEKILEMFRSEPYKSGPVAMVAFPDYLKAVNAVSDVMGIGLPEMTPSESREAKEYINKMSTPIDKARNKFWSMFHTILKEGNQPITICERAQYAAINLSYPTTRKAGPIIEFLYSQRRIVVGLYIADSTKTPCYDGMYWEKDEIERTVGRNLIWKSGDRNPNTKRVQYETSFNERDVLEGYRSKIEEILPIVEKFAEIADEYIPSEYRG